jgi:hypothetical protein
MGRITGKFKCDRCIELKDGLLDFDDHGQLEIAGGFYIKWQDFMLPSEYIICDECMFKDPRYIVRYGNHGKEEITK